MLHEKLYLVYQAKMIEDTRGLKQKEKWMEETKKDK